MSTRANIIYDEKNGVHIYQEMLDNTVCLEINRAGIDLTVTIMSVEDWLKIGLPDIKAVYRNNYDPH